MEDKFKQYQRMQQVEARPYEQGESMENIFITSRLQAAGHPQDGDWVLRNPRERDAQWIMAKDDFEREFVIPTMQKRGVPTPKPKSPEF